MSGRRRLSLRARMLVLLIGVTTIFLLTMGTVSTVILARNVTAQFKSSLVAQASYSPDDVAAHPNGYAAVLVRRAAGPAAVTTLTPVSVTSQALAAAVTDLLQRRAGTGRLGLRRALQLRAPFTLNPPGGPKLLAVGRAVTNASTGGPGILVVAQPVSSATHQVRRFVIAELITGGALLALLAIGGEWLIGRGLDPLGKMASTAHDITTRGDLNARMPDPRDHTEVALLGAAINTMLDRIQQAFGARLRSEQKVREFAADASHELRTPLTTIRGYAELYRQGALGPDQLPNAMRRIEQEAERMSTLVAELLELARLERTSSLDLTETDLAGIVRDAVADAAAVEPGRPVRAEAPPRLVAVVDEPRIRQVLANLLANVRAHTPVTAPVVARLGAITGGILIEVADGGPGMSEADAARAFDRFHRAAAGTSGAAGSGSGLGLSIVAAIAHAHGGQATLDSRPGAGTKVRVWLPAQASTSVPSASVRPASVPSTSGPPPRPGRCSNM
jgi:signal transduction histidine kinase